MTGGSDRPRVFDPDSGETLGEAEFTPAPDGESVDVRPRPPFRPWASVAAAVAVALVVGVAGGVSWQRHRDTARSRSAVDIAVRLASSAGIQVLSEGTQIVPVEIDNNGPAPLTVTSLEVRGSGLTGRSGDRATIGPNAARAFEVSLAIPCAGPDVDALRATIRLTTADGRNRSVQSDVVFGTQTLSPNCSPSDGDTNSPPQPQVVVTGFAATAIGFVATVRLTLPKGAATTQVSITAVPLTADPPVPVELSAGQTRDAKIAVTPKNACFRSATWDSIPTTFTIDAIAGQSEGNTSALLPYALYRGILHDLDVMCPAAGTSVPGDRDSAP